MKPVDAVVEEPDEAERAVLRQRAAALARRIERADDVAGAAAVTFTLARERYAIDARYVQAVLRLRQFVRIPGATPPVVAVTRWRGDVLTLLDIRSLVGAPTGALDDLAIVIIIGVNRAEFGLLADTLEGSTEVTDDEILPLSARRTAGDASILRGVTRDARLVLDAPALVARQTSNADQPSAPTTP